MYGRAPVAHLDRATASGAVGGGFEPRRVHHFFAQKNGKTASNQPHFGPVIRLFSFTKHLSVFELEDYSRSRHTFQLEEPQRGQWDRLAAIATLTKQKAECEAVILHRKRKLASKAVMQEQKRTAGAS